MGGRTALVTGANRGIGLEACRQLGRAGLAVVLTARRLHQGRRAAAALAAAGLEVRVEQLDVADPTSVEACAARLAEAGVGVDVLVNNAGVYPLGRALAADELDLAAGLGVNLLGPWRLCRAFVPAMIERGYGRVVNVSSRSGSICGDSLPWPSVYGVSKAALNAFTKTLAAEVGPHVLVNAMCPGWVATDMGGAHAPVSVQDACDTLVWLATLPDGGPSGGFFAERGPIPW